MKKYLLILLVLFNTSFIFAQNKKQIIDLYNWDTPKETILNDLKQKGWELKVDDIANSVQATNPNYSVTFCGVEVKSIMLMFSPWDDPNMLVGQSFSFKDKDEHGSFVDFFKIACKYSISMYDYNIGVENIRETSFYGYMDSRRVFFYSFDGYDIDAGKYHFVHSVTFYRN